MTLMTLMKMILMTLKIFMSDYRKKDCTTIQGAANRIGVKREILQKWIDLIEKIS